MKAINGATITWALLVEQLPADADVMVPIPVGDGSIVNVPAGKCASLDGKGIARAIAKRNAGGKIRSPKLATTIEGKESALKGKDLPASYCASLALGTILTDGATIPVLADVKEETAKRKSRKGRKEDAKPEAKAL